MATWKMFGIGCLLALAGCGDDVAVTGEATDGGTAQMSTSSAPSSLSEPTTADTTTGVPTTAGSVGQTDSATTTDATATATGTTDEPGTTGAETTTGGVGGVCGDGVLDVGENCDDGANNGPGQACKANCESDRCGDGDIGPGEDCDDGALNGTTGCNLDCTRNVCGDGVVGPGEGCDDGNQIDDDECANDCRPAGCGDGVVAATEECDDGNKSNTDECTNSCTAAACGDGFVQEVAGEACDAGADNASNGDCTDLCLMASCGDSKVHDGGTGTEECDEGPNNLPNSTCNAMCKLNVCGDGDKAPMEGCDDGNVEGGDGCSASCQTEGCGNGVVDQGEVCDDGKNGDQDDGCTDLCAKPACGDGFEQPNAGEQCDLGGANSNNGACTLTCKDAVCGDDFIQIGVEQCDDGPLNGNDKACKADCSDNFCGDGFVEVGIEECDDGNGVDLDACSNVCKKAQCNDNIKNGLETDVDCGGASCGICPTVLMLAGGNTGPNGNLGGAFTNALGWTTTPLAGVTVEGTDLTVTTANLGVGLVRYTKIGDPQDNQLQYTTWDKGTWKPLAQVNNFTTSGWPSIDSATTTAQATFRGMDGKHYYTSFANNVWSAAQDSGVAGPIAGDIAALGDDAVFIYKVTGLARIDYVNRTNGVWGATTLLSGANQSNTVTANIRRMKAGANELLALWYRLDNSRIRGVYRKAGAWAAQGFDVPPATVTTNVRQAVLTGSGGDVAIAYQGLDGKLYLVAFVVLLNNWVGPVQMATNPTITGTPAIAEGVGSSFAEVAYISNGQVYHSRFKTDFTFTNPVLVGGTDIRSVSLHRTN